MADRPLHHRAFAVTVAWTLALLYLGSVVHATESSLACPDWPTCFGTMVPEMEGGVFWEHLHRLVAGGLLLMFGLATWLVRREAPGRRDLFRASLAGMALLIVQSVFGGLTVLLLLPDAVSTTHLGLALLFLVLAAVLATVTSPRAVGRPTPDADTRRRLRRWGAGAAALVFAQSVLGGVVRHMDAGMACPDMPQCLGSWIPPMTNTLVAVHFTHRLVGVLTVLVVAILAVGLLGSRVRHVRRAAVAVVALAAAQAALGFVSVGTLLAVAPVSLHTLGAAGLLALCTVMATWGWMEPVGPPAAQATEMSGSEAA